MARISSAPSLRRSRNGSPCHLLPLSFVSFVFALGLVPAAGLAGDVIGQVSFPAPPAAASFSSPGALPGSDILSRYDEPGAARAVGPILIYVAEAEAGLPENPTAGARVRIAGGEMTPSLVAVSLGSQVEFENADRRQHRVRSRSGPLRFDLGWQAPGMSRTIKVSQTGIVPVECALDRRMRCEIVVLAHSAFVIADAAGGYRLPDLPPGRATIVAYAPRLGEVSREVEVPETGRVEVKFAF